MADKSFEPLLLNSEQVDLQDRLQKFVLVHD